MKKFFLVGAGVACLAFVGCNSQKDVSMSETSGCCESGTPCADCTGKASPGVVGEKSSCESKSECSGTASPAVVSDKTHCEGQTGECPFSKGN